VLWLFIVFTLNDSDNGLVRSVVSSIPHTPCIIGHNHLTFHMVPTNQPFFVALICWTTTTTDRGRRFHVALEFIPGISSILKVT